MKYRGELDDVQSMMGPMFVTALFTFGCANMFLSVFDEVCGTFLMCYCVDIDYNNGESKHGPPSFHDKNNEALNNRQEYSQIQPLNNSLINNEVV